MLQKKISDLYGGSISDIKICISNYSEDQAFTDPSLTLADIGIMTEGPYMVYYDFKVQSSPLLNSAFTYKIGDDK